MTESRPRRFARCRRASGSKRCTTALRFCKDCSRLKAAGQVLEPCDSRHRDLPLVILRGGRPLYRHQQPLSSDGPHEVPSDSFQPRRPAFRDPKPAIDLAATPARGWQLCEVQLTSGRCRVISIIRRLLTCSANWWYRHVADMLPLGQIADVPGAVIGRLLGAQQEGYRRLSR